MRYSDDQDSIALERKITMLTSNPDTKPTKIIKTMALNFIQCDHEMAPKPFQSMFLQPRTVAENMFVGFKFVKLLSRN